jgi:hypothetical protein
MRTSLSRAARLAAIATVLLGTTGGARSSAHVTGPTFRLSGDLSQPLRPGASAPLDVRLTNPFGYDVQVGRITVTLRRATTRDGRANRACDGTVNLRLARQYTGPTPLRIRAYRTASLTDLGVPASRWPLLTMPNLATNQDACKGSTFRFDYAATATKVNR